MSTYSNKLTIQLGIRTPLCSAPMAGASGGALAAAVSAGGGFGFIGAGSPAVKFSPPFLVISHQGYVSVDQLEKELDLARTALNVVKNSPVPIGVGFLCWQLDTNIAHGKELVTLALENKVKAIWFAFGDSISQWIRFVRDYDQIHGTSTYIFVQVGRVEDALLAVNEWKVDFLVAQGVESGGHGYNASPPLLTLIPEILAVIQDSGPSLLAAGGLSTGSHIASLLALGASGVVLGTRFLVAYESTYTDAQRTALIQATGSPTIRSMAFDHARGTLGWPDGVDGRGLRNATVDDFEAGVDHEIVRTKFVEGSNKQDPDRMLVWAGTGVTLLSKVQSAHDIVQELHQECMKRLNSLLSGLGR